MGADGVTILVAEDDSDDQLMLETSFRHSAVPCDLRFVVDGEQLMDYLLNRGDYTEKESAPIPKAVILDLNMPRKDGRVALKEIRETSAFQFLPVIVLTTSEAQEDVAYCKRLGVSEYFVKPETFVGWLKIVEYVSKLAL